MKFSIRDLLLATVIVAVARQGDLINQVSPPVHVVGVHLLNNRDVFDNSIRQAVNGSPNRE
jgi:hypothetical protein